MLDLSSYKILVVDDEPDMLEFICAVLEDNGAKVARAINGLDALEKARKEKPDLVLLDILMPKKDGFEVLEEAKADAKLKSMPIILLTNLSETGDIKRARKLGADDYLIKSHFLPSEVVEVVKKYIEK